MATLTQNHIDSIRAAILAIESAVFTVRDVIAEEDDDPHGEATRVTVFLEAGDTSERDRVDALITFGRAARKAAFSVLGDDHHVRVVYRLMGADEEDDSGAEEPAPDQSDKAV